MPGCMTLWLRYGFERVNYAFSRRLEIGSLNCLPSLKALEMKHSFQPFCKKKKKKKGKKFFRSPLVFLIFYLLKQNNQIFASIFPSTYELICFNVLPVCHFMPVQ